MTETRHADELEQFRMRLEHRAERLAKLSRLRAPAPIIAGEVALILRAAIPIYGQQIRKQFFEWMLEKARDEAGICDLCGKLKPSMEAIVCVDCEEEFKATDREILLNEADERKQH